MQKVSALLLGNTNRLSLSDQKRALLTALSIMTWVVMTLYYIITNLIVRNNPFLLPYFIFLGIMVVSFWLNRSGFHSVAKTILLLSGNMLIFTYTSVKPIIPGPFQYYIANCIISLAVFGWEERGKAFFFVGLSFFLLLLARYGSISLLPSVHLSPEYTMETFFKNLLVVCGFSVLVVYFLVSVNTSTENSLRKQEIETQKKNNELIKINGELDRFIYSTSHDLRAPLSSILGLINLADLTTDPNDLKQYHSMMRERIGKLDEVLKEILDYSKNIKSEITIQGANIHSLLEQAIKDIQYSTGADRIKIDLDVPTNIEINTDIMRLCIILNNLVSNAIKYSDHTKTISMVRIVVTQIGGNVVISIEDNGEGIDPIHHEKIFTMFYRASTKSSGSGLGLYLVKEAVEKLSGTIHVASEKDKGSTFTVTIPSKYSPTPQAV